MKPVYNQMNQPILIDNNGATVHLHCNSLESLRLKMNLFFNPFNDMIPAPIEYDDHFIADYKIIKTKNNNTPSVSVKSWVF